MARVRRLAGQRRVGHAGTLDPLAEGVLPVLLGRATRLMEAVQAGQKTYLATIALGCATDTDDAEGAIIAQTDVPSLSQTQLTATLAQFTGSILQTPPKYSALKVGGRPAYALARGGAVVDLAPRHVTIDALRLVAFAPTELQLEVTCSKGTYIRALARDIGVALGSLGYLAQLQRTRVGPFSIHDALRLEQLESAGVAACLLPASRAIPDAPAISVGRDDLRRLLNGQALEFVCLRSEAIWVYDEKDGGSGAPLCLAVGDGTHLRPRILL